MTKKSKIDHYSDKEALDFHIEGKSGKIEINSSKPLTTKRDFIIGIFASCCRTCKRNSKRIQS